MNHNSWHRQRIGEAYERRELGCEIRTSGDITPAEFAERKSLSNRDVGYTMSMLRQRAPLIDAGFHL